MLGSFIQNTHHQRLQQLALIERAEEESEHGNRHQENGFRHFVDGEWGAIVGHTRKQQSPDALALKTQH